MMSLSQVAELLGGEKVLGRHLDTQFDLLELGNTGITKTVIRHLAENLALSWKQMVSLLPVTERTLQRYNQRKHLSFIVSEQVLMIAELATRGMDVFGNKDKFLEWMKTPCTALSGKVPLDMLRSRLGHEMILDELGRIEHGVHS